MPFRTERENQDGPVPGPASRLVIRGLKQQKLSPVMGRDKEEKFLRTAGKAVRREGR